MQLKHLIGLAAVLLIAEKAAAEAGGAAFAGYTAGDGMSGYVGVVHALPGGQLGRGLAVRGTASAGTYRYDANGQRIEARYTGSEMALVYQTSGDWGWSNISAGPRLVDINLSPSDSSSRRQGTRVDLGVQADGTLFIDSSWRLSWIGSMGVREGAYRGRLGFSRVIDHERRTNLGVETAIQGDPTYRSTSIGMFTGTKLGTNSDVQFAAGASLQDGRAVKPYATIGLSLLFE